jgi:ceramide glucosyltransferase
MLNLLHLAVLGITAAVSVGGMVYYLIAISSARRLRKARAAQSPAPASLPPISLLKPLRGAEPNLERHLESFFTQAYPSFEILFAVRHETDPAVAVVRRLMERYPRISARLLFTGEPPYANAKVHSMEKMAAAARHDILVITDSDTSVSSDYLRAMAVAFTPAEVGAVTNLYRGVGGADLWSKLEALGMSTEFMAGVVVADRLEGMKFTLGPSMAIRAECLRAIGGFAAMADYLADDFVLGQWADTAGYRVALSTHVINHHASAIGLLSSFKHRLRWNRSARFSRPAGYLGQGFTYGLPWALLLALTALTWWSGAMLLGALATRLWLAFELAARLLEDRAALRRCWLIPLQDAISFITWIGGFLGREIIWRNERYQLLEGGRFAPITPRQRG